MEAFSGKEDDDKETGEENDNKKVIDAILSWAQLCWSRHCEGGKIWGKIER